MNQLLTLKQVADRSQMSISGLYKCRRKGNGPKEIQIGRLIRITDSDFEEWLIRNQKSD